jgi:nicotinamidase-related amidase
MSAQPSDDNIQALLIVDHQVGLFQLARDWDATLFKQNMKAHATIGKLFDLPVVITSSAETGPNGPVLKEFVDMFPKAPYIKRGGEVKYVFSLSSLFKQMLICVRSAWDNAEFRAAVQATGKKQFIIAGIVTDVCTAFLALSLRSEGYAFFHPRHLHSSLTLAQILRFCKCRGQRHYHGIHSRHCKPTHASCGRTPCVLVCDTGGSHARLENGVAHTQRCGAVC